MTFRAIVKDGRIVVDTHGALPDGTEVRITRARKSRRGASGDRDSKKRGTGKARPRLRGAGIWAHRGDIVDSVEFARSLRECNARAERSR
jgi:hypothetical protein